MSKEVLDNPVPDYRAIIEELRAFCQFRIQTVVVSRELFLFLTDDMQRIDRLAALKVIEHELVDARKKKEWASTMSRGVDHDIRITYIQERIDSLERVKKYLTIKVGP